MLKIETEGNNHILLFATAKEMPLNRYSKFQKYLLLEAGVGSTMESISLHFSKLHGFLSHGMNNDAKRESENLHYNFWSILQEIDFESHAFACLVHSINGELVSDTSEDNLKLIIYELSSIGITKEIVEKYTDDIKKKISDELVVYFPATDTDDSALTFYENLKRKIMLTEQLISDSPHSEQIMRAINDIEKIFSQLTAPKNFTSGDAENVVVLLESNYEYLCSMLEMNGVSSPKTLTMIEFYSRLEYFKKHKSQQPTL